MQGAVDNLHAADAKTMTALTGGGNLTEVVTALARAELTLQSATAVRDRMVQAYQDIMKMPI
jgi:flagellar hook-basal body complex protein FliE